MVVGSLSAAAALGLMGVMADAVMPATASAPANPIAASPPAVVIVRRPATAPGTVSPSVGVAAPRVTATAAAPVTSSRGS